MTLVLSIIAQSPSPTTNPDPAITAMQDGNEAIDAIVTSMTAAKLPYETRIERATYVRDIAGILRGMNQTHGQPPDIIQLIGHGCPGRLELGSYWGEHLLDPRFGSAVLDSNPDSYGILFNLIPRTSSVFLLGCHIGSDSPSGYVASGKALLFDLEDMTGANFYAASDLVYPEQFENGFLYMGPLVTKDGKPANPTAIVNGVKSPQPERKINPNPEKDPAPPPPQVPKLVRVVSAPAFGHRDEIAPNSVEIPGNFNDYAPVSSPGRLLAMAEIVFEASNYKRVEAICGLRYLRAETDKGDIQYFEHVEPPSASPSSPPSSQRPPYMPPSFGGPMMSSLQGSYNSSRS